MTQHLHTHLSASPRIKRADQIAEAIKRWVVINNVQLGDKLPNEKKLMDLFDCAKGTVREALKSLEVQGLITVKTGPNGGASLAAVPYPLASKLLRNYLHFQSPSSSDLYQLRKLLEPEIAIMAMDALSDKDLHELERITQLCDHAPQDNAERIIQRIAELDFHNLLAERCGNPILGFIGHFLNDMIKDLVIYKKMQLPEQHEFSCANLHYHQALIKALRAKNKTLVQQLMLEHMQSAHQFNLELEAQLTEQLLVDL